MNKVRICKECKYFNENTHQYYPFSCLSEEAPPTNFINGFKDPKKINKSGKCEYYCKK